MNLGKFSIRRRWLDGRWGHSLYLMFGLTFINFILIFYRFLIEDIPIFSNLIESLWIFTILFIILYIPVSILIGHWHNQTQLKVDNYLKQMENPLLVSMFRILLDIETKKASQEEIEEFKKMLEDISHPSSK